LLLLLLLLLLWLLLLLRHEKCGVDMSCDGIVNDAFQTRQVQD